MISAILGVMVTGQVEGVSNVRTYGPSRSHYRVREVARMAGMGLFAPDDTARGSSLRSIEMQRVEGDGGLRGMGSRVVVRMRFVNRSTMTAFDIYQSPGVESVGADRHMRWVLESGLFEGSRSREDTYVPMRRDGMDLAFVGALVSEPSARELLRRLVLVRP